MATAAFITLGCKVNQYETQAMHEILRRNGYEIIPADKRADVYIKLMSQARENANTETLAATAGSTMPFIELP